MTARDIFNSGQWTKARFNGFVTSILRSGTRRWAPKYECLNAAKTEKKVNEATGRIAQHYRCAICKSDFPQKYIEVDHITPMGFNRTWDDFINELFCETDNLQCVCKPCHKSKTTKEKKQQTNAN